MQRIFLNNNLDNREIKGEQFHHFKNVLRMRQGDKFEAIIDSRLFLCIINELQEDKIIFNILEEILTKNIDYKVTLIQGVAKGDKNDDIIKHSVELGVNNIIFLNMINSVAIINKDKQQKKLERFKEIAYNAAMQSHRTSLCDISISELKNIDYKQFDLLLLLDEEEAKKDNPRYIDDINLLDKNNIAILVGPEGGIDLKERQYLIENGFITVSLCDNILRTETASLTALSMINVLKRRSDK